MNRIQSDVNVFCRQQASEIREDHPASRDAPRDATFSKRCFFRRINPEAQTLKPA
jgi:hypothetical protein